ncbi:angiopoietin-1-like [Gigantopelta aegis]|uniref:angiopoietin-1-like n=1 Tax=Gigantopelta aegis TaxID=1735272 RepID=UPI001B88C6A5|nr:angiopoietin-1-like [Gigantopelta aegis]
MDYYREIRACTSGVPLTTVFQSFPVTSRIRCADVCSETSTCKAFSMSTDGTRTCSLHSDPPTVVTCPAAERHFQKVTVSPCLNKGVYQSSTDTCKCFFGYTGSRCEKIMQDCTEGFMSGHYGTQRDVFWVFPNQAPVPFKVECWMEDGGKTVMQHQKIGDVSFARSWAEYRSGFGQLRGDHWLGNDHVFYITNNRPQTLLIAVVSRQYTYNGDTTIRYHYYDRFKISDESSQYRLTFTTESSINSLGDCLTGLKNAPFSTSDVNNAGTCGSDFNAGWWFVAGACSVCNPNGVLRRDLDYWSNDVTHTHWTPIPYDFGILEIGMFLVASP